MTTQQAARIGGVPAEEAALLERLRAGEPAAFEAWVRESTPRLLAVARRMLRNEDDAQDAVQDTFASAFRGLPRFQGGSRLSTWLHRIVVNVCLMKLRSRRRKPEEPIDELLPKFLDDGQMERPASPWRCSGEALLARHEGRKAVRDAIDRLPESHRNVLLLRDIEGLDTAEAAQALGISAGAVKTRLHRARLALRELIDPVLRKEAP